MKKECEISIQQLNKYIDDLCLINHLSYQDCFIVGFSQGAMIAYELGNHINKKSYGILNRVVVSSFESLAVGMLGYFKKGTFTDMALN